MKADDPPLIRLHEIRKECEKSGRMAIKEKNQSKLENFSKGIASVSLEVWELREF